MATQCILPQIFVPLPTVDTTYMRYSLTSSEQEYSLSTSSMSDNNASLLFPEPSSKGFQTDWSFPTPPTSPILSPPNKTTPPTPTTQISFPAFPTFIPEIKSLIWRFALPAARVVPISYNSSTHFTSQASMPSMLSVCKESRDVALRNYTLTFEASGSSPSTGKIYFGPSVDIFYIPPPTTSTPNTPLNLAPFTHFTTTVTLLSRSSLSRVRRLAVHESVFLGVPGCWNNGVLVEDHLRWFWWQVCDKFRGVEEVTITGCEETVLKDFGCEGRASKDVGDVDMHDVDEFGEGEVVYEETLYNLALRTYWELRKQEPSWKPPVWRVWGVDEPRRREGNRIMQISGSAALR